MDRFLAELRDDGIADSQGFFTVDARLARSKMAAFQLPDPASYVLKIVQAAVASKAPSLHVKAGRDTLSLSFPPCSEELAVPAIVGGALMRVSSLSRSALRHLAVGLNAACSVTAEIRWQTPQGTLLLTKDSLRQLDETCDELRLVVRRKRSMLQWFRGSPFVDELRCLAQSCSYVPLDLRIDGRPIDRPRGSHFTEPVQDHLGMVEPVLVAERVLPGWGLRLSFEDGAAYREGEVSRRWSRQTQAPHGGLPLLLDGWDGESSMDVRAVLGVPALLSGHCGWVGVIDGVSLKPVRQDSLGHPGALAVFDASDLTTDFSEFRLVRDEQLAGRLQAVEQWVRATAESVSVAELERALPLAGLRAEALEAAIPRLHDVLVHHVTRPPATVEELVFQCFGHRNVHLAPRIPETKLVNATALHAPHLPAGERVLALYDDTLFGSAEEGFLITERRLCWKQTLASANFLLWEELPALNAELSKGRIKLRGDAHLTATDHEISGALFAFMQNVPALAKPAESSTLTERERAILEAVAGTIGKSANIRCHPYIMPSWLQQIRATYGSLWKGEDIPLVAYDDTLLGKADDGWVVTTGHFYWKQVLMEPLSLAWSEIEPATIRPASGGLQLDKRDVSVHLVGLRAGMVEFLKSVVAMDAGTEAVAGEA